jgi:L-idonate 5-dehydrogenase
VAVNFLNQRLIDGRPVITHTVDFADSARAFELAGDKSQAMKVQIAFGAS